MNPKLREIRRRFKGKKVVIPLRSKPSHVVRVTRIGPLQYVPPNWLSYPRGEMAQMAFDRDIEGALDPYDPYDDYVDVYEE